MTPKEKAKELVNKMFNCDQFTSNESMGMLYPHAIKCALISVDEIINSNPHSNPLNTEIYSTMEFWMQVKHEISQL